eukprot:5390342-Lingulodinium_polyedra.AAC.1
MANRFRCTALRGQAGPVAVLIRWDRCPLCPLCPLYIPLHRSSSAFELLSCGFVVSGCAIVAGSRHSQVMSRCHSSALLLPCNPLFASLQGFLYKH